MDYYNPDDVPAGERCRVTWEGGYVVSYDISHDHASIKCWSGVVATMPTETTVSLTVRNPDRVWVQSLDSEKVRDRIHTGSPNHDAILLQSKLDAAELEIQRLRKALAEKVNSYEASKALWRKKFRDSWWLTDASQDRIAEAIKQGKPEPDMDLW